MKVFLIIILSYLMLNSCVNQHILKQHSVEVEKDLNKYRQSYKKEMIESVKTFYDNKISIDSLNIPEYFKK